MSSIITPVISSITSYYSVKPFFDSSINFSDFTSNPSRVTSYFLKYFLENVETRELQNKLEALSSNYNPSSPDWYLHFKSACLQYYLEEAPNFADFRFPPTFLSIVINYAEKTTDTKQFCLNAGFRDFEMDLLLGHLLSSANLCPSENRPFLTKAQTRLHQELFKSRKKRQQNIEKSLVQYLVKRYGREDINYNNNTNITKSSNHQNQSSHNHPNHHSTQLVTESGFDHKIKLILPEFFDRPGDITSSDIFSFVYKCSMKAQTEIFRKIQDYDEHKYNLTLANSIRSQMSQEAASMGMVNIFPELNPPPASISSNNSDIILYHTIKTVQRQNNEKILFGDNNNNNNSKAKKKKKKQKIKLPTDQHNEDNEAELDNLVEDIEASSTEPVTKPNNKQNQPQVNQTKAAQKKNKQNNNKKPTLSNHNNSNSKTNHEDSSDEEKEETASSASSTKSASNASSPINEYKTVPKTSIPHPNQTAAINGTNNNNTSKRDSIAQKAGDEFDWNAYNFDENKEGSKVPQNTAESESKPQNEFITVTKHKQNKERASNSHNNNNNNNNKQSSSITPNNNTTPPTPKHPIVNNKPNPQMNNNAKNPPKIQPTVRNPVQDSTVVNPPHNNINSNKPTQITNNNNTNTNTANSAAHNTKPQNSKPNNNKTPNNAASEVAKDENKSNNNTQANNNNNNNNNNQNHRNHQNKKDKNESKQLARSKFHLSSNLNENNILKSVSKSTLFCCIESQCGIIFNISNGDSADNNNANNNNSVNSVITGLQFISRVKGLKIPQNNLYSNWLNSHSKIIATSNESPDLQFYVQKLQVRLAVEKKLDCAEKLKIFYKLIEMYTSVNDTDKIISILNQSIECYESSEDSNNFQRDNAAMCQIYLLLLQHQLTRAMQDQSIDQTIHQVAIEDKFHAFIECSQDSTDCSNDVLILIANWSMAEYYVRLADKPKLATECYEKSLFIMKKLYSKASSNFDLIQISQALIALHLAAESYREAIKLMRELYQLLKQNLIQLIANNPNNEGVKKQELTDQLNQIKADINVVKQEIQKRQSVLKEIRRSSAVRSSIKPATDNSNINININTSTDNTLSSVELTGEKKIAQDSENYAPFSRNHYQFRYSTVNMDSVIHLKSIADDIENTTENDTNNRTGSMDILNQNEFDPECRVIIL